MGAAPPDGDLDRTPDLCNTQSAIMTAHQALQDAVSHKLLGAGSDILVLYQGVGTSCDECRVS
jgi:hypothetical protein